MGANPRRRTRPRRRHDDGACARDACAGCAARGAHRALRPSRLRVQARRRAAHELPPAAVDAARARDGVRRSRGDAWPLPTRDCRAVPLLFLRRRDADSVRPRSATEWRQWWAAGGERELRVVLREAWPPLADADDETCAHYATRLATLLGSGAPLRALAADLARI